MQLPKWWRHQMETFPRYWPFVRGINRAPVNSPRKDQWRGVLMFSFICAWINGWVNNRDVGDLRRHRAHYDAIVMKLYFPMRWFYPLLLFRISCAIAAKDRHVCNDIQYHKQPKSYNAFMILWHSSWSMKEHIFSIKLNSLITFCLFAKDGYDPSTNECAEVRWSVRSLTQRQ